MQDQEKSKCCQICQGMDLIIKNDSGQKINIEKIEPVSELMEKLIRSYTLFVNDFFELSLEQKVMLEKSFISSLTKIKDEAKEVGYREGKESVCDHEIQVNVKNVVESERQRIIGILDRLKNKKYIKMFDSLEALNEAIKLIK